MKIKVRYIVFWSIYLLNILCGLGQTMISAIPYEKQTYKAGDVIVLEFEDMSIENELILHCHSSYGSTAVSPEVNSGNIIFTIPDFISEKSGQINWFISKGRQRVSQGQLDILPKEKVDQVETYLGPPTILAGGGDYTMFIAIPTDEYDNTMLDSTNVNFEHYFRNQNVKDLLKINKGFVYKRVFSPNQSGRIFFVSECIGTFSKEYDVNVQPALPVNFLISTQQHHLYADGNQILKFRTSVVRDTFNNVVSDGTMVEFYIQNKTGDILRTRGITLQGIAEAEMIHPEFGDQWTVQAIILGMAESNKIEVNFKQIVEDYSVEFYEENRKIVLGPIQSYMNQLIPDGFKADLQIFKDNILVKRDIKAFKNGMLTYYLDANEMKSGHYKLVVKVAGITKSFDQLEL